MTTYIHIFARKVNASYNMAPCKILNYLKDLQAMQEHINKLIQLTKYVNKQCTAQL